MRLGAVLYKSVQIMKKILRYVIVALTAATVFSSCNFRDKEGTYTYQCYLYGYIQDSDRAEQVVDFFTSLFGGYFNEKHSFTGLRSETINMACDEFSAKCDLINQDDVLAFLEPGEQVVLYLLDSDSGTQLMYCAWTNTDNPEQEE